MRAKKKTPINQLAEELSLLKSDDEFLKLSPAEMIDKIIEITFSYRPIEKEEIIRIVVDGYEIGIELKHGFNSAEEYYYFNYIT